MTVDQSGEFRDNGLTANNRDAHMRSDMSLHNKIPEVMDRFDFDKVHKVMTFLNWTWGGAGVPSDDQLKSTAFMCLVQAVKEFEERGSKPNGMNVATGGFEAAVSVYESGKPVLQLIFYVDCVHTT